MKNHRDILQDIKKKIYHPIYFFSGEEAYYIDLISDFIEASVLADDEKEFNQVVLYGKDTDVNTLISECKAYPMMSNYRVVIVREAQEIKDLEKLSPYVEAPLDSTILVICYKYGKPDARKTFTKLLVKKAVTFESNKISETLVPEWISSYVKSKGYGINDKASILLTEYLGNDLSKIVNELAKIFINLPSGSEIQPLNIEENTGMSKDYNVFELQSALAAKNILKANRIIKYYSENEKDNPFIKVATILFGFFQKVFLYHSLNDKSFPNVCTMLSTRYPNDYIVAARNFNKAKLRHIFALFREYDLRCKGVNNASADDGELMKELIFKILH